MLPAVCSSQMRQSKQLRTALKRIEKVHWLVLTSQALIQKNLGSYDCSVIAVISVDVKRRLWL